MKFFASTVGVMTILAAVGTMPLRAEPVFNRIAAWPVAANLPATAAAEAETSAEIIDATEDGLLLVYTDSPLGAIGMIDIADPGAPKAAGIVAMDGEPTSLAVVAGKALVAVDTSKSFTEPTGYLAVVDLASKTIEGRCDLGGQPDSVAVSPDRSLVAIAIENQRDEDLNDGEIPQLPAGNVTLFSLRGGVPDCASARIVNVTGLAEVAGSDPEPEFVDINAANEIVVSLQENNHIAVIDGQTGRLIAHYSAGAVDLDGIDVQKDGALTFDGSQHNRRREPDAVKWLDGHRIVAANEGDYEGGSRGFTIYDRNGSVMYDSGVSFEYEIARIGHYPEKRSGKKGVEPEGLEIAKFGDTTFIFVLAERASVVGVYRDSGDAPELVQLLPSGIRPEGAVAIPSRNLFVTANEIDLVEDGGARAHVMIYALQEAPPAYPQLRSAQTDAGTPIGWGALSGLAADPVRPGILYAVNDSFYDRQPTIFTIDATTSPASITKATPVTRNGAPAENLDLEGLASDGAGGFWLASQGRRDGDIPHSIYRVDTAGQIVQAIGLPAELMAAERRSGFTGITTVGAGDDVVLWLAVQREPGDDPEGSVKLVSYKPKSGEWGAVRYPLDKDATGWVGLAEIAAHGGNLYMVERDDHIGAAARIKKLMRVALADLKPAPLGGDLPMVRKEEVRDLIPDLMALHGFVLDKIEGFAIDTAGVGYAVTDNDGSDDSSGETMFFAIGKM